MGKSMSRIIFAGTPEFAVTHLQGLHGAGFHIPLVLTQPDGRVGRGRKTTPTPVKAYALEHGLTVAQPERLKDNQDMIATLRHIDADWMIVVAYGLLLPVAVLESTKNGCLNVHGSLLPRWRGAAPVQRAIEARDTQTGICIMQMNQGLDTGPIRHQLTMPITQETSETLLNAMALLGVQGLLDVLNDPSAYPPCPQSDEGVTYAEKISKREKQVDWRFSALELEAKVRALQPWPCLSVNTDRFQFKILQCCIGYLSLGAYPVGRVLSISNEGIEVACGDGCDRILLQTIQLSGGKPVAIRDFLNGKPDFFKVGDFL